MWIGAIVAGLRRRQPTGGWLFFFFWQVAAAVRRSTPRVAALRADEWRWAVVLRYALIVVRDSGTLVFPLGFTSYFFVSTRVRSVFQEHL
jgi:hypothetical protein